MAYSQNDPAWKNDFLGNTTEPGDTVGNYGCYLTAISNVCTWAGRDLNPGEVNGLCRDNGWFTQDLINRDDIPALICNNLEFAGRTNWAGPTDMSFFDDASDPNVAYIIEIDASPRVGLQTHFVMVWATYKNGDLQIDDSWDGQRKKLSAYGTPSDIIYSAIKYVKKAPQQEVPNEPTPPAPIQTDPVPTAPSQPPVETTTETPQPTPSPTEEPSPAPTTDPAPAESTPPKPPVKVVVPEPTYFKIWELIVAILKKLFKKD
jgi:hypothetical protein